MITKKMKIGEAAAKNTKVGEILMKNGLHCIGCHVAQFESIEDGCKGHGMTDEQIDKMIEEINKEVKEEK